MSPWQVTWFRTVGLARNLYSTALAYGALLAVGAVHFVMELSAGEGGAVSLPVLWATSFSPFLSAFAALVGMDVWSDERVTGRIELLQTTPVTEFDLTLGKFAGIFTLTAGAVLLAFVVPIGYLLAVAPKALSGVGFFDFVPALFALLLQGALWSAVTVAFSAFFCHAAAAAAMSVTLTALLPRGLWAGFSFWSRGSATAFGEMPLDAHVTDIASGVVPVWTLGCYVVLTVLFLFLANRAVVLLRFVGRRHRSTRFSSVLVMALTVALAGLAIFVTRRVDVTLDLPVGGAGTEFSSRTKSILAESSGDIAVTCFLSRDDARWRTVGRLLRGLKREAAAHGGARFTLAFVDPRWDVGAAEALVRREVAEQSVVFERGSRRVALPIAEGCGERACASAIRRLTAPPRRRDVFWTVGHGEGRFDDYTAYGMSDIARDLLREGYSNRPIDLAQTKLVPGGCALIVIAGARQEFSRSELDRLDAYLKEGGRLLVLLGEGETGGLATLLATWGLKFAVPAAGGTEKTLSGTDVIVSDFSGHAVAAPLKGSRIVLERPFAFSPSAVVETMRGADRLEYTPVASVGERVLVAAVERGGEAGADVAIRPTRLVAVGDATFAFNASLAARANANRDFFLNCVAYLAGTDASASSGTEAGVLKTDLDRHGRRHMVVATAAVAPLAIFVVMTLATLRRRRRK